MVKPILNFIFAIVLFCSCGQEQKNDVSDNITPLITATSEVVPSYDFTIFLSDSANINSGFGYNITMDNHIFIHQPTIPSVPGNHGFPSKAQAERTAAFVIYKLTHNIMPPSVTPNELDSLGVLNN